MNVLDIAHAACAEVGIDPAWVIAGEDPLVPGRSCLWSLRSAPPLAGRACRLATMAAFGPDHLIRCTTCRRRYVAGEPTLPCIPVRDDLRGVTCS